MGVCLRGVTKRYGDLFAVKDLDLEVRKGEFLSLVGPSGCGKTTTLRMVAGFLRPDGGELTIRGRSMKSVGVRERKVGMVFQNYALFPNLSVHENVAFGLKVRKLPSSVIAEKVDHMLSIVGLEDRAEYFPRQLSGGQQQRVALARALAIEPQVLLLDEPLSALDAKVRNSLRFEIKKIQSESGITTIYVTHDQEEALSISDRVALMNAGRLEQIGTPGEIYSSPASLFVADFVGVNNLLNVSCENGRVRWKNYDFEVSGAENLSGDMVLALRPEKLHPCMAGTDGNVFHGKVTGRVFLGPLVRVALEVDGVRVLVDMLNSESGSIINGTDLAVSFDPSDGCLV